MWSKIKLGTIADFRNGVNFNKDSFGEGIKVINVADFKDRINPDLEGLGELSIDGNWSPESFLKVNDILFVRSNGNKELIGRTLFINELPEENLTFSAFCIRLRFHDNNQVEPKFYLYLFKSQLFRKMLSAFGSGTNISNLNQDILSNLSVPLPPLPIQQKIASILSSYDELIENNNQRITLLEQMAEEIYKEWFVRLRFPSHEHTHVVEGLLEGWENGKLGELVEFRKGKNITESTVIVGEVPVVAGGLSPAYFHNASNTTSPTVTISASGANAGYVNLYYENIWASDCSYLDTRATNYIFFFYVLLKSRQTEVTHLQKGSAQPHVYPKDLMSLKVVKPPQELVKSFNEMITPFFEEIKVLKQKNECLKQTRDLLLPRLISNKLSVEHLLKQGEQQLQLAI